MRNKKVLWIFIALSLAYLGVSLLTPTESSVLLKYGLSETEARFLKLTITLPIILIWFAAYYGWTKFSNYAHTVRDGKEGPALKKLSDGLLVLIFWLPLTSVGSSLYSYLRSLSDDWTKPLVIFNNYYNVVILLIAFVLLYQGSVLLFGLTKSLKKWRWAPYLLVLLTAASAYFAYLTLNDPHRMQGEGTAAASYYLPDWMIAATIIFPYLVIFYLAFKTIDNLHRYRLQIKGVLYKKALIHIANGIGWLVLAILGIRYLVALSSVVNGASLKGVLALIYSLVLLIALGYLLIAFGSKRLQKIEEV